jgi:uncharacterized membrane protein YvlD (DUF360 family)
MTVDATTSALARPRLDVGLAFKNGWNAFTADIVPLLVGTLIAGILSVITLGILAGPLTAGLYSMVVGRIRDGRHAEIGDVFSCMNRFWGFLWAAIVLVVLIALASLTIVGGVLLATIWIYVFPFMVDRKMGLSDAMSASYHQVVDNGFWEHLALIVVFFAIGAVANGWVGVISTPFTIAVIVGAYFVTRGPIALIEQPTPPPALPAATAEGTQATVAAPPAQAVPAAEVAQTAMDAAAAEADQTTEAAPAANEAPTAEASPATDETPTAEASPATDETPTAEA